MEKVTIEINLDEKSIQCLNAIKNKKLVKIGYVMDLNFSLATALIFEDFNLAIENDVELIDDEEFAKLVLRRIDTVEPVAYEVNGEKVFFEFKNYDMPIDSVEVIHDYVSWNDDEYDQTVEYNIRNIVILHSGNRQLIICARHTVAESIEIYETDSILEDKLSIKSLWAPLDENGEIMEDTIVKRIIEKL